MTPKARPRYDPLVRRRAGAFALADARSALLAQEPGNGCDRDGFKNLYSKEVGRAMLGRAANAAGVTGSTHHRDLIIGHLAPGEILVPPWALSPAVMAALRHELGNQLPRFIVGAGFERRNPISGLLAFSPANEDDSRETADPALEHDDSGMASRRVLAHISESPVRRHQPPALGAKSRQRNVIPTSAPTLLRHSRSVMPSLPENLRDC